MSIKTKDDIIINNKNTIINNKNNVNINTNINTNIDNSTENDEEHNIDIYLEKEKHLHINEPWNKLTKIIKLKKITEYTIILGREHKLTNIEIKQLKKDLINYIDKKQLQKTKDVVYDKDIGQIKSIPNLLFNKTTKKFTIKRNDKQNSTIKSLGPKKINIAKKPLTDKIDTI